MKQKGKKPWRKIVVTAVVTAVVLMVAYAAIFLYERAQVALIIDDEAAWDVRDSLSAAQSASEAELINEAIPAAEAE